MKNPGCLRYLGDEILPSYVGITFFKNQDLYENIVISILTFYQHFQQDIRMGQLLEEISSLQVPSSSFSGTHVFRVISVRKFLNWKSKMWTPNWGEKNVSKTVEIKQEARCMVEILVSFPS